MQSTTHDSNAIWQQCYLGLGSNLSNELGNPKQHIAQAIAQLKAHPHIRHIQVSSLYSSKPMGPQDQPDFINAVVGLETTLEPLQLLDTCQQLEQNAQRQRLRHWGERSLDVDILLYGEQHIQLPTLTIPHAGINQRNFVLVPLAELNPKLIIHGKSIEQYPMSHDYTGLRKLPT
ncbi:2-amino-4-hydroxy-6-hydroxymethyldihydropteridine diphosphokinase [Psychrobacter sp. I-STPA6b]|uniref:2-amino-4-hydroxy-6- hydroxymethyldihydropteridine diphosphokinase n=1 Tax=Psychrobacter sp. I-STPA6b TaxID=2585718 RepID=UPI001D0C5BBF|nr:2-amino-4-hydroxy-6-hydroxymethyldihydropteridine diphosphokinase [Psychrobacter sp. I-STPA6b]